MPQISKSRDHSELQDMYRRALAASWASQQGELPADQCVEEIFAGGDGWKLDAKLAPRITHNHRNTSGEGLDVHHRTQSGSSTKSANTITGNGSGRFGHKHSRSKDATGHASGSPTSPDETSSEGSERGRTGFKKVNEVSEFDIRDDLMAWRLPEEVS
jgi:hypothetical protein